MVKNNRKLSKMRSLTMPRVSQSSVVRKDTTTPNSSEVRDNHLNLLLMRMLVLAILSKYRSPSNQRGLNLLIESGRSDLKRDCNYILSKLDNGVLLDSLTRFVQNQKLSFDTILEAMNQVYQQQDVFFGIGINQILEQQTVQNALSHLFFENEAFQNLFSNKIWTPFFQIELLSLHHSIQFGKKQSPKVTFSETVEVQTFSVLEDDEILEIVEVPVDDVTELISAIQTEESEVSKQHALELSVIAIEEGEQSLTSKNSDMEPDAIALVNASAMQATSDALEATSVALGRLEVAIICNEAKECGETLSPPDLLSYVDETTERGIPLRAPPALPVKIEIDDPFLASFKNLSITSPASSLDNSFKTDANSLKVLPEDPSSVDTISGSPDAAELLAAISDDQPNKSENPSQYCGSITQKLPMIPEELEQDDENSICASSENVETPPLPTQSSPLGGDIGVGVDMRGNPQVNESSSESEDKVEEAPVQVFASSGDPPGNSDSADHHPKSSQVGTDLSASLPLPDSSGKVGKPVRPLPPTPIARQGQDIGGRIPQTSSNSPGTVIPRASDPRWKLLPPMLNWNFSRKSSSSISNTTSVYSRPLGHDIGGTKRIEKMVDNVILELLGVQLRHLGVPSKQAPLFSHITPARFAQALEVA